MTDCKKHTGELNNVEDQEYTARFLSQSSNFSKNKNRVKHFAFHPPKGTSTTSVFRYNHCTQSSLIGIGEQEGINIKAIASILVKHIKSSGKICGFDMFVVPDTTENQHHTHAHIVFPFKNIDENFHKIKDICMEIAKQASLIRDSKGNIVSM